MKRRTFLQRIGQGVLAVAVLPLVRFAPRPGTTTILEVSENAWYWRRGDKLTVLSGTPDYDGEEFIIRSINGNEVTVEKVSR
jgi:hypothetical protein